MSPTKHLLLLFLLLPQLLLAQIEELVNQMSWEDLVAVVDDYQRKGMFVKSFPYAKRMQVLAVERYHKKESYYAAILHKTAKASEAVGDWDMTKSLREELLDIEGAQSNKKNAAYASALVDLAVVELNMGNFQTSEALCWQAKNVKIFNSINDRYYPLQSFNRSIDQNKDKEKRDKVYKEYLEAKRILIKSMITLASNYRAMGDEEAYDLANRSALNETTRMIRFVLGKSQMANRLLNEESTEAAATKPEVIPDDVIADMRQLLKVFENFENYEKGEKLYLETMDLTRGSDLYEPLALNLANIYIKIGEYTGAKMLYTKLLQNAEEKEGTESIRFAYALANLAGFYMIIEDSSEAAKFYLKAKGIVLRLEGRESENYIQLNKQLKEVYRISQQKND